MQVLSDTDKVYGHLGVFEKTKQNNKGFHCVQKICSCFRVVSGGGGILCYSHDMGGVKTL